MKNNMVLVGLSGVGKSTIAKELAKELEIAHIDIDDEIIKREEKEIAIIFKEDGEEYFRKRETEVLSEYLAKENYIIATGGGIVISETNRESLQEAKVVWLVRDIEEILKADLSDRPLLKDKSRLYTMKEERNHLYNEVADIQVENIEVDMTVQKIKEWYCEENSCGKWTKFK